MLSQIPNKHQLEIPTLRNVVHALRLTMLFKSKAAHQMAVRLSVIISRKQEALIRNFDYKFPERANV